MVAKLLRSRPAALVALLLPLGLPATANLLSNGGFEEPPLTAGTYLNLVPGSEPSGFAWTVLADGVDVFSDGVLGTTVVAADGTQALDLVGFGSTGGVSQGFASTWGQVYRLSFQYANNPISTGDAAASLHIGNGEQTFLSDTVVHSSSTTSSLNWTLYEAEFIGTGGLLTLSFATTLGGSNGGIVIDAVAITAVPEPAPAGLLLLGLAAGGLLARRMRSD
jgi:hypothetical protein